ncbi:hypothetical protein Mhypo_03009 [Meiothermus hypogaeus]|uniref:Uncharacterized protein n=1 Tax=Meiothermus hypogaeus TaxID=884155 RepID=A0ABX9MKK2_9DEIN|nr:hypothetical protein Mhypo_03009 [Meiothermus hypogaeus]
MRSLPSTSSFFTGRKQTVQHLVNTVLSSDLALVYLWGAHVGDCR